MQHVSHHRFVLLPEIAKFGNIHTTSDSCILLMRTKEAQQKKSDCIWVTVFVPLSIGATIKFIWDWVHMWPAFRYGDAGWFMKVGAEWQTSVDKIR
jgi:hypothetical protein